MRRRCRILSSTTLLLISGLISLSIFVVLAQRAELRELRLAVRTTIEAMAEISAYRTSAKRGEKFITLSPIRFAGLGNQLFRFASLYGLGRRLNRTPYFHSGRIRQSLNSMLGNFNEIFPDIADHIAILEPKKAQEKVVKFAGEKCCSFEDDPETLKKYSNETYLMITGNFMQARQWFEPYYGELRKILRFHPKIVNSTHALAEKLFKGDTCHKLCVHIRRGDFLIDTNLLESRLDFTRPALQFIARELQSKKTNFSIVLIGEDDNFKEKIVTNDPWKWLGPKKSNDTFDTVPFLPVPIYRVPYKSKGVDLLFAGEYCNSLLITASGSTFAWWMAFFKPDQKRVFINNVATKSWTRHNVKGIEERDDFNRPEWRRLHLITTLNTTDVVEVPARRSNRDPAVSIPGVITNKPKSPTVTPSLKKHTGTPAARPNS